MAGLVLKNLQKVKFPQVSEIYIMVSFNYLGPILTAKILANMTQFVQWMFLGGCINPRVIKLYTTIVKGLYHTCQF